MDLNYFFFKLSPALQFIFKISYIPREEDFKELTPELYEAFGQRASEEDRKSLAGLKIYALLPDDPEISERVFKLAGKNLFVVSEEEIGAFYSASKLIDKCCGSHHFESLHDKLKYLAETMPDVFTEDTPYAKYKKR